MKVSYFSMVFLFVSLTTNVLCQEDKSYYLILSSRGMSWKPFSMTGHAFVTWATLSDNSVCMVMDTTMGFYPHHSEEDHLLSSIEVVEGEVMGGFGYNNAENKKTRHVFFQIDSLAWHHTRHQAKSWSVKPYFLFKRNCVSFLNAMAEAAGIETPSTYLYGFFPKYPTGYLSQLIDINENNPKMILSGKPFKRNTTPVESLPRKPLIVYAETTAELKLP